MKARGTASKSLPQPPCPCRAGPSLQTGSQLSNTCLFPGSMQILQSLSECTFTCLCLPSRKVGCVSLPLSASCLAAEAVLTLCACQLCCTHVSSTGFFSGARGESSLPCAPKAPTERGAQRPGRASPLLLSYSLLKEHMACCRRETVQLQSV